MAAKKAGKRSNRNKSTGRSTGSAPLKPKSITPSESKPSVTAKVRRRLPKVATHIPYVLLFCVIAVAVIAARIHLLSVPFDRDEGAYGYLGWLALSGGTPYVDFYEMKPPLLFYSYGLIVAIFGKSPAGFHLAALLLNCLSTYFIYRLGKRIWGISGGLIAATTGLVMSINAFSSGFALQSEHLVLAYAMPGMFLTFIGAQDRNLRSVFFGGFLLACSALVKQNAIFYCAAGVLIMLLYSLPLKSWSGKVLIKWQAAFIIGALVPVSLTIVLLAIAGSLDDFWYWIYQHPRAYLSAVEGEDAIGSLTYHWRMIAREYWFWIGLTATGLIATPFVRTLKLREKLFLSFFFILTMATIVPGMRFYGHYWLLFFPGWCLVAPGFFNLLNTLLAKYEIGKKAIWFPALVLMAGIVWHIINQWAYYYKSDPDIVSHMVYRKNYFPEHQQILDWLSPQMDNDDQLIVMGSEPQMYLYANKKAPTRHFYMTYTSKPIPAARGWEQEVIDDLKKAMPEYVIFNYEPFSWMFKADSPQTLYKWMYRLTQSQYEHIAYMDLQPGGGSTFITGDRAKSYSPKNPHYIVVSKLKENS